MKYFVCAASVVFFVVAAPMVPVLFAQQSCGGILTEDDYDGNGVIEEWESWLDEFDTCEDRDSFAAFFGTTVPEDIALSWGEEVLTDGSTHGFPEDEMRPLLLTWEALPEIVEGCGGYGENCVDGLAVEVFVRDGDQFRSHWYGAYAAPGVWTAWLQSSPGATYAPAPGPGMTMSREGEYYFVLHRPLPLMVNFRLPQHDARFALRDVLQPVHSVLAYDGEQYRRSVVGGFVVSIARGAEAASTLRLPTEDSYSGARGVVSSGPLPERGLAEEEVFTFKVVYTNSGDIAPDAVRVMVAGSVLSMQLDTGAVDSSLRDGAYANGEQYVATSTLPRGGYTYEFAADTAQEVITLVERIDHSLFTVTAGYSSVAFVPGFQAGRLFTEGAVFENQLWEPNRNADALKLVLNEDGTSLDTDIYTKTGSDGVIDEVLDGLGNIYKSFLSDLEEWKEDEHLIRDYMVLPYDWRLAFDGVLEGGTVDDEKLYYDASYATDTPYIFAELERLAQASDSGRVTIVSHSMGGLLVKKMLADMEDNPDHRYRHLLEKIDMVLLVATPQLGTPKATASLLHGIGQDFGPLASQETLRALGHHMPSAYTLLPSEEYFEKVHDIDEDGIVLPHTTVITGRGDEAVTTYGSMRDFFDTDFGEAGDDLTVPLQPRAVFLDAARVLHERVDGWLPPDMNDDGVPDFQVVQVAGWGMAETIRGIRYVGARREAACSEGEKEPCYEDYLDPRPMMTFDGDETVVVPSAVVMGETNNVEKGVQTWYVDMYQYNLKNIDRNHASILEIDPIRSLIHTLVQGGTVDENYLHAGTDTLEAPEAYLRLAMHSPVDVSIADTDGNRVGVSPDASDGQAHVDEEVPNSYYFEFGEGTYLGVPLDGTEYTIALAGTGEGLFTFELTEEYRGLVHQSRTFSEVPVTADLQAELTLSTLTDKYTLEIDTDGDGESDTTIYADEQKRPASFTLLWEEIKKLDKKAKKKLLRKMHGKKFFMLRMLKREIIQLASKKKPQISERDAARIIEIIDELIAQLKVGKKEDRKDKKSYWYYHAKLKL